MKDYHINIFHSSILRARLLPLVLLVLACMTACGPASTPLPTPPATATATVAPTPPVSDTATPDATPTGFALASINGWVWHDECASGVEGQPPPATPPPGCVADGSGGYRADGTLQSNELLIGGVKVLLGSGACPSSGLMETTTITTDLSYSFTGLNAGTYCVSIDPLPEPNASILLPGGWTYPQVMDGPIGTTVALKSEENRFDVNFGWDYQFLPVPTAIPPGHSDGPCTYQATFQADVTIPDNTVLPDATSFVKTWRVRNDGTCTWGPGYALHAIQFVGGTQLASVDRVEIPAVVPPGSLVDISVSMTSAIYPGTYRSEWKLVVDDGRLIGVGPNGDVPLYVQIVVSSSAVTPSPVRITFPPGAISTSVQGTVAFPNRNEYILRALAGQEMTVEIISADGLANFAVQGVSDGQPLKRLENEDRRWMGTLPATQDYLITVATPSGTSAYTLVITIVTP